MRQERDAAKGAGGAGAVASRLSHALGLAQLAQEAIPWGEILSVAAPQVDRSRSASRELPAPASLQPQPLQGEPSSQFKGEMSRDTGEMSRAVPPPPAPSAAPAAGQAAGQVAGQVAGQAAGQVAGQVAGASQPTAVESARLESLAWLHSLARGGGGGRLDGVAQAEPEGDCRAGAISSCAGSGGGGGGGGGSSGGGSEGGATMGEEGARPALSCSPVPPSRSPLGGTPLWESTPDRSSTSPDRGSISPGRGSILPGRGGSISPGRGSRADQAADQVLDCQPAARATSEAGGGGGVGTLAASGSSGDAEVSTGPPPPPLLAARLHAAEAEVLRLRVRLSKVQEERDVWRLASQVTNS